MNKKLLTRWGLYLLGMLILVMGLVLNTKSCLGSSPIISLPYTLSFLCDISFSNLTLLLYVIFVFCEFPLKGKQRRLTDLLQIPLSIVFTRFMSLFSSWFDFADAALWARLLVLLAGIVCTGIGAALTVDMELVANPGDAFVQAVSIFIHKEIGLTKNIVDVCFVVTSAAVSFLAAGRILGVGAGTLIAMVLVGRTIYLFNRLFKEKLTAMAL